MSDASAVLAQHCRQVAQAAGGAIGWLRSLSFGAPEQRLQLEQELRHIGDRAEMMARIVSRPATVAMFGPNQSGKSFLAAALARRNAQAPRIVLGEETVDFIASSGAAVAGRSSACVTRYTMRDAGQTPPGLPVAVSLLSPADVIRVVANAFLEDIDPEATDAVTGEEVRALLEQLRGVAGPVPRAGSHTGLDAPDVADIRLYFERYFADHPVMRAIDDAFWTEAAALAPRLTPGQRVRLFEIFWGRIPQLSALCVRLLEALHALGNPVIAFCERGALIGGNAIVDVETMMQGLEDDAAPRLRIGTPDGLRLDIARPQLAALVCEVHLQLAEQPYTFFKDGDLLDFPGMLPRNRFTDPESLLADPTNRAWLYRRGKAAYLFQNYVHAEEISALVLCLEDGPQTSRALPRMVKEWIDQAQGASPEQRALVPCNLFVALTKFDRELSDLLGQRDPDPDHWRRRLQSVFGDFLSREDRWSERWTPGRPFAGSYWLRVPAAADHELMSYDSAGRETGFADKARVANLRGQFLATAAATRYFADPQSAWDEAARPNDGGVSYLAGQLRGVCDPDVRRRTIAEMLGALARDMHQILEPLQNGTLRADSRAGASAAPQSVAAVAETRIAKAAETQAPAARGAAARVVEDASIGPGAAGVLEDAAANGAAGSAHATPGGAPAQPPEPPGGELPLAVPVEAVAEEPEPEPTPPPRAPEPVRVIVPPPPVPAGGGGAGLYAGIGAGALVVIGVAAWFLGLFGGTPPAPAPEPPASVAAPAPEPVAPAPAPETQAAATPSPATPPTAAPAAPEPNRCGPLTSPERFGALPSNLTLTPGDLVCVARLWIAAGRPGDAVLLLTRALQESPNRVHGPAALELARLYDPRRQQSGWPPNAAYAMEKYQEAADDAAFPDVQAEARAEIEELKKAQGQ